MTRCNPRHDQPTPTRMLAGAGCITVSFRPAIPRRVAPQQSPLPLRRHGHPTPSSTPGKSTVPAQLFPFFVSHHRGAPHPCYQGIGVGDRLHRTASSATESVSAVGFPGVRRIGLVPGTSAARHWHPEYVQPQDMVAAAQLGDGIAFDYQHADHERRLDAQPLQAGVKVDRTLFRPSAPLASLPFPQASFDPGMIALRANEQEDCSLSARHRLQTERQ
jgi:hypothetical protein